MNISRIGNAAADIAAHKAKEQAKYLNAGGETTEIAKVTGGSDAFSRKLADVFKRENSDLIQGLSELSDSDKMEIAMNSYFQMQGRLYQAINREEADIKTFGSIADEKARITSMLGQAQAKGGSIETADGNELTAEEISGQLDDVQRRMDAFFAPYGRDSEGNAKNTAINESVRKDFAAYASAFEGVTGMRSDALDASDALALHKTDRDESNFVQKAEESINSLKKQSESLTSLKKDLLAGSGEDPETERLSEEAMVKLAVFEFFREKFSYGGTQEDLEEQIKSMSLFDTRA